MKKKIITSILGLASAIASGAVLAGTQTVRPSTTSFNVSAGDSIQFAVTYPEGNPEATGLGITLYFDSSKLTHVETSGVLSTPSLHQVQSPAADSSNGDGDVSTDQKIVVAFANFGSDPFLATEDMPANLFTVNFTAAEDISSDSTINFTGTVGAGNTFASTPVSITYSDTTAPSITAPADVSVTASSSPISVTTGDLGTPIVTDDTDTSPSVTYSPQGPFAIGTHTITWTATDSSNNSASDTQTLTIVDNEAPTITAPIGISTPATGTTTAVTLGTPTVSDNTDSNPTVAADNTGPFSFGENTITWTATDASGNSSTATQTVTITDPGIPALEAPADIIKEATGTQTSVEFSTVSVTDVFEGELAASVDNTGPFSVGSHTIIWSVSNSRSGVSQDTQIITITDTTAPVITVPETQTVQATGEFTSVEVGTATATDLVDGVVTPSAEHASQFQVGTHTITWTATDAAGNASSAVQTIIVTDSDAPIITAPADQTVEATDTLTAVELGTATASDAVDGMLTATADQSGPFALGTHTITWSATDSADNASSDTQTITVQDTTAPTVQAPANQSVSAASTNTTVALGTASASDLVDDNPTVVANQTGPFSVGTHTITWTATDASGNAATAEQTVTVTDNGAPSITAPSNVTKEAVGATTSVTLGVASALDAVDGSIAATADNTGPFAVGIHSVTWTATDTEGNSATAVQTVTITDTTTPTITLPADITQEATAESTPIEIGTALASDLVDGDVTVSSNSQGPFPVGTNSVIWTATDRAGNAATATQTITITDGAGPEVTAPADILVEATGATTAVSLGDATAADTVDGNITAIVDNEGPFVVGVHTFTWTATDSAGNVATDTQTVTVEDTTAPVISIESQTLELNATGVITPLINAGVTATDLVDGSTTVIGFELIGDASVALSEASFISGTHRLVWKATDNAGNSSSITQTLNITPQANFTNTQVASAGDEVTVSVELSGTAVSYPVTIPYSIDTQLSTVVNDGSDHDASNDEITIASGTSGSFTFNVAANPVTENGDLVFNLGTPSNAIAGAATIHKVIISADNIAPSVEVQMIQGEINTTKVITGAGNVVITAAATDSAAQTLSYDWSQSDTTLADLFADSDDATFEIDPSSLADGFYKVIVIVSDNGSPIGETTISTTFKVETGTTPVADDDGDGVENNEDHVAEGHRLAGTRGGTDQHILESEQGTRLSLGSVARGQDRNAAGIENANLPEVPEEYEDIVLDIYDFEISGVVQGESALIVLPQHVAIPANAVYLKSNGATWKAFVEDDNNALYSAAQISSGICPTPGDASYASGLKEGDFCVQLKIEDGGANDTDGLINGTVADPGVVVALAASSSDTGTSGGGGGTLSWFFMSFLLLLGLVKKGLFSRR